MASTTSIANRALQLLGAKRVTSLSEDSRNARSMNVAYEPVRDALLQKYPWSFAVKRAALAADGDAPLHGRARSFTLPSDYIRLLDPYPEVNYNDRDWFVEGNAIYTNESAPLNIRYISRVTDPNLMHPLFREMLSHALAEATCVEIAESNTRYRELRSALVAIAREARAADAFIKLPADSYVDPWETARL